MSKPHLPADAGHPEDKINEGRREALKAAAGFAALTAFGGVPMYLSSEPAVAQSSLPPWVPAPGTIADVSLNTLRSTAMEITNRYHLLEVYDSWSGITYFPWWGRYGTFVATGGGHSNTPYNHIFAYSVEDRLHTRIKRHAPYFLHRFDINGTPHYWVADGVTGWMYADATTEALQVGEAFAAHTYAYTVAIPPGLMPEDDPNEAPNGWLFTPGKTSIHSTGQKGTNQSHRIAVGASEKWKAFGPPLTYTPAKSCAFFDSKRNRVVALLQKLRQVQWIDVVTGETGLMQLAQSYDAFYHTGFYDAAKDLYLAVCYNSPYPDPPGQKMQFFIIDPNTNLLTRPVIQGELPTTTFVGGWDWVPEWKSFVFYPGNGSDVWTLSTIDDNLQGPYVFEKQTLSGAPPIAVRNPPNTPHYNRFRYVRGLGCFLWFPHAEMAVQAFGVRPPSTYLAGRTITSLTVSGISGALIGTEVPFSVGHAFLKGDVTESVRIDGAASQCNVLNRWDDGSVKFAVLTGVATFNDPAKTFEIKTAPVPTEGSPAPFPTRNLSIEAAGVVVNLAQAENVQVRFTGNEMTEFSASKTINEHMVAFFHVRAYRTGDVWVRWTVHNGYLHVAGAKNFAYQLIVSKDGEVLVNRAVDQKSRSRITGTCWFGRNCQTLAKHDRAYLNSTKLVPNFGWNTPTDAAFTGITQTYIPMGRGNLRSSFPTTGYDDQIGLLPRWDALYLTSGDARAYNGVIANAESGGSFSVHYLDETTRRPLRFSAYPTLKLSNMPYVGGQAFTPDVAHQPSVGYLAYLLTGDAYFLEEVQHWANYNYLMAPTDTRGGSDGVFRGQSRAVGWALRTLATASIITPDDDPLQAEYARAWGATMTYYHKRFITGQASPAPQKGGPNNLGAFSLYAGGTNGDAYQAGNGIWQDAPWMQHFLEQALAFGMLLEVPLQTTAQRNEAIELRNFAFKHVIGMLGVVGDGRPYQYASSYHIPYGTTATLNELQSPITHYPSWTDQWEANKALEGLTDPTGNALLGSSGGSPVTMATGYWGNLHPAIALAVDAQVPGAAAAYARLTSASNYAAGAATFNNTPQFGIVPR